MIALLATVALATTCPNYADPESYEVAGMPDEISGIAASRVRADVFYAQADGGNSAELHAFSSDGDYLGVHRVAGAANGDWEDIAAGPCPDGTDCLYIGDIGDNDGVRETIAVVVAAEPSGAGEDVEVLDIWEASFPDGNHDAETLLVHPCDGRIYVLTKEEGTTGVYRFPPDTGRGVVTLEKVTELDTDFDEGLTGGDWDQHGERVAVRSNEAVWEWETDPDAPDGHWGEEPRRHNDIDEPRGEGVAFGLGSEIVTASEGTPMPGHVLECAGPIPPEETCAFTASYDPPKGCGCSAAGSPSPLGFAAALLALTAAVRPGRRSRLPGPR